MSTYSVVESRTASKKYIDEESGKGITE